MIVNILLEKVDAYLLQAEHHLDKYIDSGSDQELFVASYIHGHFSVIAANLLSNISQFQSIVEAQEAFKHALTQSISTAIDNKELEPQDAKEVLIMLNNTLSV